MCCFSTGTSLRVKNNSSRAHKTGSWFFLLVSDEHPPPRTFLYGSPPTLGPIPPTALTDNA